MNELLTTGEMIERLKVGQVAESENGDKVTRTESGSIDYTDSLREVSLSHHITKTLWRILPNYISLSEAIEALRVGKNVSYYTRRGEYLDAVRPRQSLSSFEFAVTLEMLSRCHWVIEED